MIVCANFFIHFVYLTLANILEDGSTIRLYKVTNFTPSIFSAVSIPSIFDYCHHRLKYILLLLQFAIFSALHCKE